METTSEGNGGYGSFVSYLSRFLAVIAVFAAIAVQVGILLNRVEQVYEEVTKTRAAVIEMRVIQTQYITKLCEIERRVQKIETKVGL